MNIKKSQQKIKSDGSYFCCHMHKKKDRVSALPFYFLSVKNFHTEVIDAKIGFIGIMKSIVNSRIMSVADPSVLLQVTAGINILITWI